MNRMYDSNMNRKKSKYLLKNIYMQYVYLYTIWLYTIKVQTSFEIQQQYVKNL